MLTITTEEQFDDLVGNVQHFVVLVGAAWCEPCKATKPGFEELASIRPETYAYIDSDELPYLARRLGAKTIPTTIFFEDGVERGRRTGVVPKGLLERDIVRVYEDT